MFFVRAIMKLHTRLLLHKTLTIVIVTTFLFGSAGTAPITLAGEGESTIYLPVVPNERDEDPLFLTQGNALAAELQPTTSYRVSPKLAGKASYDEAVLEVDVDAVAAPLVISITSLPELELPDLDQGMTNVTKGPRRGYRFLPHNTRFKNKIRISLPYNKSLIPPGLTEQDIKTFYFDEEAGSWKELERVVVDTRTQVVTSLTDHFTDMINATVTVPDHPQVVSFDPTSMQNIQAADPGAGIHLIEPPSASSMGDARISYPIELPPGRNGMEPLLSLGYNSGAGNGWLGAGWDLSVPAVTIDTRWGVPRYGLVPDRPGELLETETYVLNGEQLTPGSHRGELQPRTVEKIFHTRVEERFQKIIRHGDHPTNYWWEVVDKGGTRFFYGGDLQTNGPIADATLADANGNIFQWALREVRDLNGNGIQYSYNKVCDRGVVPGCDPNTPGVDGFQIYLKSINYTQSGGAPGTYTVTFVRDRELGHARRSDVMIDARGGFKMVTADLLKHIEVRFNNELIRSYELTYKEGAFRKTLLESVTQFGEDGSLFNTHAFAYYPESSGFAETTELWDTGSDEVTWATGGETADDTLRSLLLGQVSNEGPASAIGGAVTDGISGHAYIGYNQTSPTKQNSVGGKVGFNHSETETLLTLTDLNGDGLPDKVFLDSQGDVFLRLNQSGPGGVPSLVPPS
jgi:hypothetical protein